MQPLRQAVPKEEGPQGAHEDTHEGEKLHMPHMPQVVWAQSDVEIPHSDPHGGKALRLRCMRAPIRSADAPETAHLHYPHGGKAVLV